LRRHLIASADEITGFVWHNKPFKRLEVASHLC
jgi:hypothetical protein